MSKEKLIEKILERVLLPEHDSPELKEEIAQNLSRVSEKVLGWLENRIELSNLKARKLALEESARLICDRCAGDIPFSVDHHQDGNVRSACSAWKLRAIAEKI